MNRPGAKVRARKGFVAPKPAEELVAADTSFAEALGQGMPASGLRLEATATPLAPAADDRIATGVTIRVTYEPQEATAGITDEQLRFGILALDPDARIRVSSDQRFSFSMPPQADGNATMTISSVIELPRGPSALRLGMASRATGRTGTVHLPIDLPDLSSDDVQLGGIIVGLASDARERALDCTADLPLAALAPGEYALAFAARLGGTEPVSRAIPFVVR